MLHILVTLTHSFVDKTCQNADTFAVRPKALWYNRHQATVIIFQAVFKIFLIEKLARGSQISMVFRVFSAVSA